MGCCCPMLFKFFCRSQHTCNELSKSERFVGCGCPMLFQFFCRSQHTCNELLNSERLVGCGCPMLFLFFFRSLRACNEVLKSACSALDITLYSNLPNSLDDIKQRTYGLLLPYAL